MKKSEQEEPVALPVKIDSTTNGEFWPRPLDPLLAYRLAKAKARASKNARRLGLSRRDYLSSTCGAAPEFAALNQLGCRGGRYALTADSALDKAVADRALKGREFIFDVPTHAVSAARPWWDIPRPSLADFLKNTPRASCGASHFAKCFTDDVLIKEVFLNSDTSLAVLSALWGYPSPIEVDEAARTREQVAKLEGKRRLRIHGGLQPNEAPFGEIVERMQGWSKTGRSTRGNSIQCGSGRARILAERRSGHAHHPSRSRRGGIALRSPQRPPPRRDGSSLYATDRHRTVARAFPQATFPSRRSPRRSATTT
jgi:hypothetical protein